MEQRTIRPRIADVAREAGVSKTAVSFAFNSPDRLAPETAERIRDVAEQLGYTPHPVARMLTQRQTLTPRRKAALTKGRELVSVVRIRDIDYVELWRRPRR